MASERAKLKCGPVDLVDDHGFGWVGANGLLLLQVSSFTNGVFEWSVSHGIHAGVIESEGDFTTPEAAAEDLARFLGELHEATEPFAKEKP